MNRDAYRVVGAPWALGPSGPAGDVVALEHVREGGLCLVFATTIGLTLDEIEKVSELHDAGCPHA